MGRCEGFFWAEGDKTVGTKRFKDGGGEKRNADMMNAGLDEPSCVWLACKQVQAVLFAATAAIYPLHPSLSLFFFIPSPAAGVIGLHIESKFPNFSNTPSSFRQNEGRKTKYKSGSELLSFSLNSQWTNCEKKKCWGRAQHTHITALFSCSQHFLLFGSALPLWNIQNKLFTHLQCLFPEKTLPKFWP